MPNTAEAISSNRSVRAILLAFEVLPGSSNDQILGGYTFFLCPLRQGRLNGLRKIDLQFHRISVSVDGAARDDPLMLLAGDRGDVLEVGVVVQHGGPVLLRDSRRQHIERASSPVQPPRG